MYWLEKCSCQIHVYLQLQSVALFENRVFVDVNSYDEINVVPKFNDWDPYK